MRLIALLVLLAVLPTAELTEQVVHVIEHVVHGESPAHPAHHDASQGDEHGCTGLVHLCMCHQTQVTAAFTIATTIGIETSVWLTTAAPGSLTDLTSREPASRPPIA